MNRFIVVDGPDGAGKTTLTANLAEALRYVPIKTPSQAFRERRAPYDLPGVDPVERFHFYAQGVLASCDEIRHAILGGSGVVVDRYTHSLELHHSELSPSTDFPALVKQFMFPLPDLSIILTADLSILCERIIHRAVTPSDACLERNTDYVGRVLQRFRSLSQDVQHIDTGANNIDQTVQRALTLVNR